MNKAKVQKLFQGKVVPRKVKGRKEQTHNAGSKGK